MNEQIPFKVLIGFMNVVSCYWSLYKYARYFAQRHPKLNEDHKAVGMVLKLEEMTHAHRVQGELGKSMTVKTVKVRERDSGDPNSQDFTVDRNFR
jgi:hypothetical protein